MEDTRVPGHRETVAREAEIPEMPLPSPDTLVRGTSPYMLLVGRHRYAVGWHDTTKDGPCFVVVRLTVMDSVKILDRFPLTQDGWVKAWTALVKLDAGAAQATVPRILELNSVNAKIREERDRRAALFKTFVKAGNLTVFQRLGVQVLSGAGQVYTIGSHDIVAKLDESRLLGPLAGAEAMVTDGSQAWSPARAMLMPLALTVLATKTKADAAVVFPDGSVHTVSLDGNLAVREAQKQVVQFNALASVTTPVATETGTDPAVRLRKLQELLDAGLLSEAEYQTKRADIINSI